MANRRMFSSTVTKNDWFLDLPLSSQALYFHIGMEADDDGFCASAKTIMRTIGANQNDFDMLVAKRFLLKFESGVVVVKHWRVNNLIRKDFYHPTEHRAEKAQLYLKPNGIYTLDETQGTPLLPYEVTPRKQSVNELLTEDRLGKDRLVKDSLGKESLKIELDRTRYKQSALCGILVDSNFISIDELEDPSWDSLLDDYVREYGYLDTKVKLKYFLTQTCFLQILGEDKEGRPIFGKRYQEDHSIGDKFPYFKTAMDRSFAKFNRDSKDSYNDDDEPF